MIKDCTAIITTFNRKKQLLKLIESIKKFSPMPIIVVDNGKGQKLKIEGLEYYKVPFDAGLSYSRNFALDKVLTKYFLLLDDDFEFTKETKIKNFKSILEKGFDLVGGKVEGLEYHGLIELEGETLRYLKNERGFLNNYPIYDMVLNFFMAKTKKIKEIRWDNDLKLAEHTDFFFRAKNYGLKITYEQSVKIKHNQIRTGEYAKFRKRGPEFVQLFMKKHGIKKIVNFIGAETLYLEEPKEEEIIIEEKAKIDFLITYFGRKENLENLLFSIAKYYPKANILIADQTGAFRSDYYKDLWRRVMDAGLIYKPTAFNLFYDFGLSACRNYLLGKSELDYILILEEDFIFYEETDIDKMLLLLEEKEDIMIAGGMVVNTPAELHFEYDLEKKDKILHLTKPKNEIKEFKGIKYLELDCVFNFFLARSELFYKIKWDKNLKINGEHLDFFLRLKELGSNNKVVYLPEIKVKHDKQINDEQYQKLRSRKEFLKLSMKKNGIKEIRYPSGFTYFIDNNNNLVIKKICEY
jgi:hypothetical protein